LLRLKFPSFVKPYKRHLEPSFSRKEISLNSFTISKEVNHLEKITKKEKQTLLEISHDVENYEMSLELKKNIFFNIDLMKLDSKSLKGFFQAVDWANQKERKYAMDKISEWNFPDDPLEIINFLNFNFHDTTFRKFIVGLLENISDDKLALFLPLLVQLLKYETSDFNALSEFLLRRGEQSFYTIGNKLFWLFKIRHENSSESRRFILYTEDLISRLGFFAREIYSQYLFTDQIYKIAETITNICQSQKIEEAVMTIKLRERINSLSDFILIPNKYISLPLFPQFKFTNFCTEKCKVLNSKQVPTLLSFCSNSMDSIAHLIIKVGNDLRQDDLCLQFSEIIKNFWLEDGLLLELLTYQVLAIKQRGGLIEVVEDSETLSDIQQKYGGGPIGALRSTPIMQYLKRFNKSEEDYKKALESFIRSCAGSVVASHILGVGDRHSGNLMITRNGRLFHIDFGHFMGNFKTKFGIKREKSSIVLTKEIIYLLGGKDYKNSEEWKKFCNLAIKGFLSIRKRSKSLIGLFEIMMDSGISQLSGQTDLSYLRDILCLEMTEMEASKKFKKELGKGVKNVWRRVDNVFHNIKSQF